ncbi:hypothetical protein EQM14_03720 [Caproiciproducens sp. NJN-50]|uniref:hypothetical protein n=1 Tax=Caproiciproducens sp. NJN-50 TaxID=2507162 RepID=UPI000FFE2124|nr:hypothetical protein [Caproiciproducens sp. NJN-50]QAT48953.1 hypothetical protein EQM14_03720 [Caproiciproducens sp. NJN-50]
MPDKRFGPRRARETRKPEPICGDPQFFLCESCGSVFQLIGTADAEVRCCSAPMKKLQPVPLEAGCGLMIDYEIVGGFNENAVKVTWYSSTDALAPEWICLKTFTGGQLKYIPPSKHSIVFALADTDAYCYCDEDPCLECTFRCKRGFALFAWNRELGLLQVPMDKMKAPAPQGSRKSP